MTLVRNAFHDEVFKKSFKQPAIYLTDDFANHGVAAGIRYQGELYNFVDFLSLALKTDLGSNSKIPSDGHRTTVRWNENQKKRAA